MRAPEACCLSSPRREGAHERFAEPHSGRERPGPFDGAQRCFPVKANVRTVKFCMANFVETAATRKRTFSPRVLRVGG